MIIGIVRNNGPEKLLKDGIIQIIDRIMNGKMIWDKDAEEFIKEYITSVLHVGLEELLDEIEIKEREGKK